MFPIVKDFYGLKFLTAEYQGFLTTVPMSQDFYGMLKLRELVHYKTKTLVRIAWHF